MAKFGFGLGLLALGVGCLAVTPLEEDAAKSAKQIVVPGVWVLRGKERAARFTFKRDGTFAYAGSGAESKGTWIQDGLTIRLVWSSIDGQKVSPGRVRAAYTITADGTLKIDNFEFYRSLPEAKKSR